MQSKVSVKVFFFLHRYVVQHRSVINKNQKKEALTMHFSKESAATGTVIKSPLLYEHGSCIQKHLCVCSKELKKPKPTHLA